MNRGTQVIKPAGYAVVILFLFWVPVLIKDVYVLHVLIMAGISIILASSLRSIASTGQFSLAHAGFMAVGAYTSALLTMKLNVSFWVALPLGGVTAGVLALVVGYPFVRVKRVYFAMLTLFLGQIIRVILTEWRGLTGGNAGLLNIPRPDSIHVFDLLTIGFESKISYYYLMLVLMLICLLTMYRIDASRAGRTMLTIQQADFIAESIGINVSRYKVISWTIGCFFAGIAGGFYAHYLRVLNPDSFGVLQGIYVVVYMIVGGRRRFYGAILGAFLLTIIPEVFRPLKEYQPFVFVGILFLIIFLLPGGLVDFPRHVKFLLQRWKGVIIGHA